MGKLIYSEYNPETGRKKYPLTDYDFLPKKAKWLLHENCIKTETRKPLRDSRTLIMYQGVDALQHLGIVRKYVTRRFKISGDELDALLYLYPFNYFTKSDYRRITLSIVSSSINHFIKKDLVVCVYDKEAMTAPKMKKKDVEDVYTLSLTAKRAVTYFYKLISGEMKPYNYKNSNYDKNDTKNSLIIELLSQLDDSK